MSSMKFPDVLQMSPVIPLAALSIAIALILVALWLQRRSRARRRSILLLGALDAGKTAILSSLVFGQRLPTVTSMQTNSALFRLPDKRVLTLIDVPGHPRLREEFREHIANAKAVVFVVDASNVSRNGPVVAEHLHHVLHALVSLPPSKTTPRIVILAHKCDLLKASAAATSAQLAVNRVRTVLERELEKRRASQAGAVGVEGLGAEGDEGSEMGGLECSGPSVGVFRFAEWEGGEIEFLGTSAGSGRAVKVVDEKEGSSLLGLRQWLAEL